MNKNIKRMLDDIKSEIAFTQHLIGKNEFDSRVMKVMGSVPRDQFVPVDLKAYAFDNGPLSIGHGQTISQPYIVALMTDLLQLEKNHRVLEIGTGSGYQTAVLANLVEKVFTVELIKPLADAASKRLKDMNLHNIETHIGNGYEGWAEHAPYDAIIVTAAAANIPPALIEQLKPGGRLVIPVGLPYLPQELMLLEKDAQGNTETHDILGVAFVPLQQKGTLHEDNETLH